MQKLADMVWHGDDRATLFTRIATNRNLDSDTRFYAALCVGKKTGISLLIQLAESVAPSGGNLIRKASMLAQDGYREAGATILVRLAQNPTAGAADRAWAARDLARVEGYHGVGAILLANLAESADLEAYSKASFALVLATWAIHRL
jgi:hypothetical protein